MFRQKKLLKTKTILEKDMRIIIPHTDNFFDHFRKNIIKGTARLDAEHVLEVDEKTRFKYLIDNFDATACEALINALIDAGYKKESKPWTIKNLF